MTSEFEQQIQQFLYDLDFWKFIWKKNIDYETIDHKLIDLKEEKNL